MHPETQSQAAPDQAQIDAGQESPSPTAPVRAGPAPASPVEGVALLDHAEPQGSTALQNLLDRGPALALQPAKSLDVPTVINARPVCEALQVRKARRHGRVARLPKLPRDMVGRMLSN